MKKNLRFLTVQVSNLSLNNIFQLDFNPASSGFFLFITWSCLNKNHLFIIYRNYNTIRSAADSAIFNKVLLASCGQINPHNVMDSTVLASPNQIIIGVQNSVLKFRFTSWTNIKYLLVIVILFLTRRNFPSCF